MLILMLIIMSCEKPESKVGLELLPTDENLGLEIDSSTVLIKTVFHDSLRTDRLSSSLLGDIFDPVIGNTKADIYFQLLLSNPNVNFGDGAVLDSMVLSLAYNSEFYGSLEEMKVSMHQLSESITLDTNYFSYSNIEVMEDNLVSSESEFFTPNINNDVIVGDDTLAAHLRIKFDVMNTDIGTLFLSNEDSLASNSTFLPFFKGLKVSLEKQSMDGGLLNINLFSELSNVTLYYHTNDIDSLNYTFVINEQSQQFVGFSHDYNEIGIDQPNQENVYVQSTAGLGIEVTLPNLYDFTDEESIIINRAILELPVESDDMDFLAPNETIKATMIVDGDIINIPDGILEGSGTSFVGGVYDADDKVYRLTVTRFVQRVLNGQIEQPIFTVVPNLSRTVANRAIIKVGNLDEDRRAKLIINYTSF